MSGLVQATLQRLTVLRAGTAKKPMTKVQLTGRPLPVQFNPTTLRLARKNNVDRSGVTTQSQKAQSPSVERATLSFDLEFDTAEQGAEGAYVDVRRWTALVRQFVEPPPGKPGEAAPAVQFSWGTFAFSGIVDQVTEELDHFAPDGTPLHAKVSLSIAEQEFRLDGAAARTATRATEPGQGGSGTQPGQTPNGPVEQVAQARNDESAQQLLTRLGLDPRSWRGAMSGLDSPLNLAPGLQVQITAGVTRTASVGQSAQFAAEGGATSPDVLARALGTPPPGPAGNRPGSSRSTPGGRADQASAGFTLAAAGGLSAAEEAVTGAQATAHVEAARSGFEVPTRRGRAAQPSLEDLTAPRSVDPRARTYGTSVPLQSRVIAHSPRPGATAPWEVLPPVSADQRRIGDGRRRRWTPGGECR